MNLPDEIKAVLDGLWPGAIHCGDCRDSMASMPESAVDSIITDPPYGLKFMGKAWDHGVPGVAFWEAALRVAKPGAMLLAFGGTRTHHRLMCGIEDAGWQIRDCIMYLYGTGFPKSLDISKAIDKAAGAKRKVVGQKWADRYPNGPGGVGFHGGPGEYTQKDRGPEMMTDPATESAKHWNGYGTALKPLDGTFAENALKWGVAGLWIDGCRVGAEIRHNPSASKNDIYGQFEGDETKGRQTEGRWPANVIHDGSSEVLAEFAKAGQKTSPKPGSFQRVKTSRGLKGGGFGQERAEMRGKTELEKPGYADTGSAARFFYTAKASKAERNAGLGRGRTNRNRHPTVKPLALMEYLCKLVRMPAPGVILDPFCGSGTTCMAAQINGQRYIGLEISEEYCAIARKRLAATPRPMFK